MEDAVVLYPSPGIGHLIPMVELAKLILNTTNNSFSITILIITPPTTFVSRQVSAAFDDYIAAVSAATPAITFLHHAPPTTAVRPGNNVSFIESLFENGKLNNPIVLKALQDLSKTSNLRAFVIDIFCDAAFEEVSPKLGVPTYFFFPTGTANLVILLYMKIIVVAEEQSSDDKISIDRLADVPGLPSNLTAADVVHELLDKKSKDFELFMNLSRRIGESCGVVINTFELLDRKALKAISDGVCVPDGVRMAPVFDVGPIISTDRERRVGDDVIMSWLDEQPRESVVFLCFGSAGMFSAEQLGEMARGLEDSGWRFLWVVRDVPPEGGDALAALPAGFLERTRGWGLVVKDWAPQVAVLSHDSVGGFVTHCGWNSVLEAAWAGVPMVAWPLYAEQNFNRVVTVRDMRIALAIRESGDDDGAVVRSIELEERVRELMGSESERGKGVREKVLMMQKGAIEALQNGGSSQTKLTMLTQLWKQN